MKRTSGLSKDEMISFARTAAPQRVDVDVAEFDEHISLKLSLNFGVGTAVRSIAKIAYQETNTREDAVTERIIAERTRREIKKKIESFCEGYFKMVLQNFGFENRLRRGDEIYCVNRFYEYKEAPNFTRRDDLDLYYLVNTWKDLPHFEEVWRRLVYGEFLHPHSEELLEYFHGIMERYKQALFAKDLLSELLEKNPDNDVLFLVNFHFYYYNAVIKALGDSLAWILNYFYDMGLERSPSQIDLTKTPFKGRFKRANEQLFKEICQGSLYEKFRDLRKFRDIVVHRHALHVVTVQFGTNGASRIMVPVDPVRGTLVSSWDRQKGQVAMNRDSVAKYGLKQLMIYIGTDGSDLGYVDVIDYCNGHLRYITESYNKALKMLVLEASKQ